MKKLFSLLAILSLAITVSFAQKGDTEGQTVPAQPAEAIGGPVMEFETTEIDYGTIEQHADPLRVFNFTNTGTEPLIIKHAKGSCGCTVPNYPKEPILPGEASKIEVRYDTKRIGRFTKTITLTTNESSEKRVLRIKGEVKKKPPEPEALPASAPSILSPAGGGSN